MIPKILTIEGLYSYRAAQVIDFETLTQAEVFGIFGPVGSGKSSILEAILFALYDKTERLSGGDKLGPNMMNLASSRLWIDFIFTHSGQTYRFTVENHRRKKHPEETESMTRRAYQLSVSSQAADQVRSEPSWLPLVEQGQSITAEAILGLSYDAFRRTVIIPQGKFQDFLQLGRKERTDMVKELFELNRYDLNSRALSLKAGLETEIHTLQRQLDEVGPVKKSEIEAAKTQLTQSQEQSQQLESTLAALAKELSTLKDQQNLALEYTQIQNQRASLTQAQPQIDELQDRLNTARIAKELQPLAERERTITQRLSETTKNIQEITSQTLNVQQDLNALNVQLDAHQNLIGTEKELRTQNQHLIYALDYLAISQQLQDAKGTLTTLTAQKQPLIQQLTTIETSIQEIKDQTSRPLPSFTTISALQNWNHQIQQSREHLQALTEACSELESKASQITTEDIQLRSEFGQTLRSFETALGSQEAVGLTPPRREGASSCPSWAELLTTADSLATRAEALDQAKREQAIRDNELQRYRQTLKPGEPCPICGSLDHPGVSSSPGAPHTDHPGVTSGSGAPHTDHQDPQSDQQGPQPGSSTEQRTWEELLSQIHETQRLLLRESQRSTMELQQIQDQLDTQKTNRDQAAAESQTLAATPPPQARDLPREFQDLAEPHRFSQTMDEIQQIQTQLEDQTTRMESLEGQRNQTQASIHNLDLKIEGSQAEIRSHEARSVSLLDQLPEELSRKIQEPGTPGNSSDSATAPASGPDPNSAPASTDAADSATAPASGPDPAHSGSGTSSPAASVPNSLPATAEASGSPAASATHTRKLSHELQEQKAKTEADLNILETQIPRLQDKVRKLQANEALFTERVANLSNRREELQTEQSQVGAEIEALLTEHGMDRRNLEDALQSPMDIPKTQAVIEDHHSKLISLTARLTTLKSQGADSPPDPAKIATLEEKIASSQAERDTLLSSIGALRTSIEEGKKRLARRTTLETQLTTTKSQLTTAAQVCKLLRGNAFLDFVAHTYLTDLVRRANTRFMPLTRQSLQLELGPKNEFVVVDLLHGGSRRSIRTLSGGQTFQAAFSLAISLADYLDHGGGGFFFMDEGFGSLDRESLEIVFQSLRTLRKENRLVGIISHVEDLKQEIQTFLAVENLPDQGSRVHASWE